MRIDENRAAELLEAHDNILILTHMSPDGDTLGSGTALCRVLLSQGKKAAVVNSDPIPEKYDYLVKGLPEQDFEPEYIVAVDIATPALFGKKLSRYSDSVDLCIDHHPSNSDYAGNLHLMPGDGATCLTLYRILEIMGAEITPDVAGALYTGLSTDTGCFRYSNADAECYRVAAELIDCGADNAWINNRMFETKPVSYYRLIPEVFAGMRLFADGRISVFKVTNEMLERTGATEDVCDSVSAMARQMEGVLLGITMKQKPDGSYKFSLRTHAPLDASEIAKALGGGGHMRAAGCAVTGNEEEALEKIIKLAEEQLDKQENI